MRKHFLAFEGLIFLNVTNVNINGVMQNSFIVKKMYQSSSKSNIKIMSIQLMLLRKQ